MIQISNEDLRLSIVVINDFLGIAGTSTTAERNKRRRAKLLLKKLSKKENGKGNKNAK